MLISLTLTILMYFYHNAIHNKHGVTFIFSTNSESSILLHKLNKSVAIYFNYNINDLVEFLKNISHP